MQQIISFLLRNKHFLLFLCLIFIGLVFTIQAHSYHKSKFINAANSVTGGVYETANNFDEYLNLKDQNQDLMHENAWLRRQLSHADLSKTSFLKDSMAFSYIPAQVVSNSTTKQKNILIINRGEKDGVKPDMGVITSNGIVGIIGNVSTHYSSVISVLYTESSIGIKVKKNNHIGTLTWNGKEKNILQLSDITKVANVKTNDTIVTGDYSIFPKNLNIGQVINAKLDDTENYFNVDIKLFNDMNTLNHVYIVNNKHIDEINALKKAHNDNE